MSFHIRINILHQVRAYCLYYQCDVTTRLCDVIAYLYDVTQVLNDVTARTCVKSHSTSSTVLPCWSC